MLLCQVLQANMACVHCCPCSSLPAAQQHVKSASHPQQSRYWQGMATTMCSLPLPQTSGWTIHSLPPSNSQALPSHLNGIIGLCVTMPPLRLKAHFSLGPNTEQSSSLVGGSASAGTAGSRLWTSGPHWGAATCLPAPHLSLGLYLPLPAIQRWLSAHSCSQRGALPQHRQQL